MYLVTTLAFFLIGGLMALVIRLQLESSNGTVVTPERYAQIFTMHGTTMIFLFVVPVDVPVHLSLQSKDVIHDWWVEELGQKTDVIPGRTTHTWFRADKIGSYVGQCAEFCGPGHAGMLIIVKVVSQDDFATYLADKAQ